MSGSQAVIGLVSIFVLYRRPKKRARLAPTLDERMGRSTFPRRGRGERQEASPATGKKARRKVFGMRMKRYLDDFSQRPCGGTARRQIGRPLPAVPEGGNKNKAGQLGPTD